MRQFIKKLIGKPQVVYAHCDIPCGIYDPHQAQIAVLTVIRMVDLIHDYAKVIEAGDHQGEAELELKNNLIRATAVKEEHAEMCKKEVRVIWGDYFKDEHFEKYPELDGLVRKIMRLASKAKQATDRKIAVDLLTAVNRLAEIFWETKGVATKRVKAPYKPEEEIVYPVLG
jgi:nickel superoxide dismutase